VAEDTPAAKKKSKKPGTGQKAALGIGGAVVVYVLYRWYQNRSSSTAATTTAATDPLTGQPYTAGVGSLAAGTDQGAALADPTIDPSTGQTWASEIAAATTSGGTDPLTGQPYSSEIGVGATDPSTGKTWASEIGVDPSTGQTWASEIGVDPLTGNTYVSELPGGSNYVSPVGSNPSTPSSGTSFESRDALILDVAKATGLSNDAAGQQVALYLEGKPLTNAGAVNAIGNQVRAGLAPTTNGTTTLPLPVLAKGVTAARPAVQAPARTPVTAKK
jgi:hypothetical protein